VVVGARAEGEGMVRLVLWGGGGWLLTTLQNRISTFVQWWRATYCEHAVHDGHRDLLIDTGLGRHC